ncbi:MAG: hypothetical protein M1814_003020 [Vezdaea aestivalis]|nr:MAG: hypothetical protein M1814_003020 [Vezdaea aestivalis]
MWGLTIFDVFMRQFNANVTKLYVIVGVLILAFGILSVIYTIGAILSILTSELEFANQDIARRTKLINTASLTVITLIGAATLALGITVAVNAANSSNVFLYSSSYYSRSGIRHAYEALNSTFSILQFVISIVIIGVAIMWLNKAPKPGATHKSAVYMLGLVATPFFVFSFVLMILVIHFELQKYSGDAEAVAIVVAIFSYIPVAVLFLGLSLVSRLDPNSQVKPATGITPIVGPNVHEAPNNRISHPPQHLAPPPNGNTTWQPYNPSVSPASTQSYGPTYPVQQVQPQTWGQTMSPPPQAPQQQAWGHSSSPPPQQPHYGQQQAYQQPYNPQAAAPMPNPLVQYR